MKRLIIIGAGGHGRVVADIARQTGYNDIVFLDNDSELKNCAGYPVLGPDAMTAGLEGDIFIAVGDPGIRRRLMERECGRLFPILIHPQAIIASGVVIGDGSVVMAGAVINPGTRIGRGCIVNTSSSIDHDCVIGEFCHLAVGAHLAGTVHVGDSTWIGIGAVVSNNVNICSDVIVGAGAVVIKDIEERGTYIGIPTRKMDRKGSRMNRGGIVVNRNVAFQKTRYWRAA